MLRRGRTLGRHIRGHARHRVDFLLDPIHLRLDRCRPRGAALQPQPRQAEGQKHDREREEQKRHRRDIIANAQAEKDAGRQNVAKVLPPLSDLCTLTGI
jgi:hypothetical protein